MSGDSTICCNVTVIESFHFFSFDLFRFPFASKSQYIQRVLCE